MASRRPEAHDPVDRAGKFTPHLARHEPSLPEILHPPRSCISENRQPPAKGWVSIGQAARIAGLDHFAFGVELGERCIARQYALTEAQEDIAHSACDKIADGLNVGDSFFTALDEIRTKGRAPAVHREINFSLAAEFLLDSNIVSALVTHALAPKPFLC